MKEIFKRYLVFVIGLYFLAAGIVLIIRSALGTTPISSINYVLRIEPDRILLKFFFSYRSLLSFRHSLISI